MENLSQSELLKQELLQIGAALLLIVVGAGIVVLLIEHFLD
jgi:hypothetical protein